ncbi:MAG: hypothetical protein AAGC66_00345 [Leifsonia sp.]
MFKRSVVATALAAVLVVAGGSGVAASADTTPIDPYLLQVANGEAPTNPTSQVQPRGVAPRAGGSTSYAVTCTGQIQDPHYASGAGGAIAKVDVTCKGSGVSSVSVRARGLLTFAPSSSATNTNVTFSNRATSDQTQTVAVNGAAKTYYLPQVGSNGGRGTGFWRATFTWQITSLPNATVGSDTKTIWKTI